MQNVVVTLGSARRASYYVAMRFSTPSSPLDVVIFVFSRDEILMLSSVGAEKRRTTLRFLVLQPVTGPALVIHHKLAVDVMPCPFTSTSSELCNRNFETSHQHCFYNKYILVLLLKGKWVLVQIALSLPLMHSKPAC